MKVKKWVEYKKNKEINKRNIIFNNLSFLLTLKRKDLKQVFSSHNNLNKNIKQKNLYSLFFSNKSSSNCMELVKVDQRNHLYSLKPSFKHYNYSFKLWLRFHMFDIMKWFAYIWTLFVITFALYQLNRILNMIEMGINIWSSIIHSCIRFGLWIYNKNLF